MVAVMTAVRLTGARFGAMAHRRVSVEKADRRRATLTSFSGTERASSQRLPEPRRYKPIGSGNCCRAKKHKRFQEEAAKMPPE
jgi:hypothetical protein